MVAAITGSMTIGIAAPANRSAIASTTAREPSMPVLIASAPMSSSTARAWATIRSGGIGWMAWMRWVSCTVIAVMALAA